MSTSATQTRNDELTLAGLRPGRDDLAKAERLFSKPSSTEYDGSSRIWQDRCRHQLLAVIPDADGMIAQVRVAQTTGNSKRDAAATSSQNCPSSSEAKPRWLTGHGLVVVRAVGGTGGAGEGHVIDGGPVRIEIVAKRRPGPSSRRLVSEPPKPALALARGLVELHGSTLDVTGDGDSLTMSFALGREP